jgi:predicted phosphodiesterase
VIYDPSHKTRVPSKGKIVRFAILSDIHGNTIALDAVLADLQTCGPVDGYWLLGDYSAIGYDPVTPLARLEALPNAQFIRGNTEEYVTRGTRPGPSAIHVQADISLLEVVQAVSGGFGWTQGYVTAAGWFDWMAALPLDLRMTLPDGTRVLGVHASPGESDGVGFFPTQTDETVWDLLAGVEADLVLTGHTHTPHERHIDGIHMVNAGSISNPLAPDLRASYLLLDADESCYTVTTRFVEYDHEAVIEAVKKSRHPGMEYIIGFQKGIHYPYWLNK